MLDMKFFTYRMCLLTVLVALNAQAENDLSNTLTTEASIPQQASQQSLHEPSLDEPSVEANIFAMDTDHNGMVTVEEMRIYVQSKHGSSYQNEALKKMEAAANSRSCASPFSGSFY
jgi:Ca2+-binding EF-hand superfamily protein